MKHIFHLTVAVLLLLCATSGRSTTVIKVDLPKASAMAETVVEGRTVALQGYRGSKGQILTRVTVAVSGVYKGQHQEPFLEFSIPVGEVDGQTRYVSGFPKFKLDQEAVLFLSESSREGVRIPVGLGQGKFNITYEGGRKMIHREALEGIQLISERTGRPVREYGPARHDYDAFMANVVTLINGGGK